MPAELSSISDSLAHEVLALMPALRRYVRFSFPRLCYSQIEDAASAVLVVMVEQTEIFEEARAQSAARLEGLCKLIAWRHARGIVRRRSYRCEKSADTLLFRAACTPNQEAWVSLLELGAFIDEACQTVTQRHAMRLAKALRHCLVTGDTETHTARLFGVKREHINRARWKFYETCDTRP